MAIPSGTTNLQRLPRMIVEKIEEEASQGDYLKRWDKARKSVHRALMNRDLTAFTRISNGKYNPTGETVQLEPTDWLGDRFFTVFLTGVVSISLGGESTQVEVWVDEGEAIKWIKSVTGGAAIREALVKDETACKKWLIIEMGRGDKPVPKGHYETLAKDQFNLGPNPFQRAWGDAIKIVCNPTWNASGPIKNGPDPQTEVPLIKGRLLEFMTLVRDTNNS